MAAALLATTALAGCAADNKRALEHAPTRLRPDVASFYRDTRMAPGRRAVRLAHERTIDDVDLEGGPGEDEQIELALTHGEASSLQQMLRENVTNDLDLLEDLAYADRLGEPASDAAIERIALAVRLDVQLGVREPAPPGGGPAL